MKSKFVKIGLAISLLVIALLLFRTDDSDARPLPVLAKHFIPDELSASIIMDKSGKASMLQHTTSPQSEESALLHLAEMMDQYHQTFNIYTDADDGGNHFVHRAFMGDAQGISIDDAYTEDTRSGCTAIRNSFSRGNKGWGGVIFQNGVLLENEVSPRDNWGTYPNAGYDLTGATQLTFWARGKHGGERVKFLAFVVQSGAYPNSASEMTTGYVTLSTEWRMYTINLANLDLSYIIDGFGWVTNADDIVFYLDDIKYDLPRLDDLRFLRSYNTLCTLEFDSLLINTAFTYDNALALIAFVADEDQNRAKLLADTFIYAQEHDRFYTDGRLRNAYQAGDLVIPPGWTPNGRTGTVRLPGFTHPITQTWTEDEYSVGTDTGNMAWTMIALLNYYERWGGEVYLNAAVKLGDWIVTHTYDTRGNGGYTGGYTGWETDPPEKDMWKSTEHNLDLFVAFSRLYEITNDPTWQNHAQRARHFVEKMWNEEDGYYATGTLTDGKAINENVIPLDAQTWALLAFGPNEQTMRAVDYGGLHHYAVYDSYEGFDFNTDRDAPWSEGTGQMVLTYQLLGETDQADHFLDELQAVQSSAPNADGKGLVATPAMSVSTGFETAYYNRIHVGATAWYIFAEQAYNPYHIEWPSIPFHKLTVTGPSVGAIRTPYTFTVDANPVTATWPVTYTWQATDQPLKVRTGLSKSVAYTWNTPGPKSITATVTNLTSSVTSYHHVTISVPLSDVSLSGPEIGIVGHQNALTATVSPMTTTLPITYVWQVDGETSVTRTGGLSSTFYLTGTARRFQTIYVTVMNETSTDLAEHTIAWIEPVIINKLANPVGQVDYGDLVTYTLFISETPGTQIHLYDPLTTTRFLRFVERPTGITYVTPTITGTLNISTSDFVVVSFIVQVATPITRGVTDTIRNHACSYALGQTLGFCRWSNEVTHEAFRPYEVFLPLVLRGF
jgi:hypothetical protein